MKFLLEVYKHSETFQTFAENATVGHKEVAVFLDALTSLDGKLNDVTLKFLKVLGENKRFIFVHEIAEK